MEKEKTTGAATPEKQTLTSAEIERAKEELRAELRAQYNLTPEQVEEFLRSAEEANQPIPFDDEHFELGAKEPDIRSLSTENKIQMLFRTQVQTIVALRGINSSLIDIMRLILVLLDKIGVENITKGVDSILHKLAKQNQETLKGVLPNNKN